MARTRRLAAIMFTDIAGFTQSAHSDESSALERLREHQELLRSLFPEFQGREVKSTGDGFLVEFESALQATHCAAEIQRRVHQHNLTPGVTPVQLRIGVHIGDVEEAGGDILGDAVNIASRVERLAEPGGACISRQVYDQVRNKVSYQFDKLAPQSVKGLAESLDAYRIVFPWTKREVAPRVSEGHRLAVLPLANISPDASDEYFADGLTEELISVLSQVRDLGVIARTSVAPYKQAPKSVAQVGAELGVDSILEGSVRKAGNRIRITLQLVDVATQQHIWASSYNREIDDVFAVQSDIAGRTAEALRLSLSSPPRSGGGRAPTTNPAAYDAYLRGRVAASKRGAKEIDEAVRYFQQATSLDPSFAEAFAVWADLYVSVAGDYRPMAEVMPPARELAARALELDPDSSDAHSALANIAMQFDHDWVRAEKEYRQAIALNPSNVSAYRNFGLLLVALGRAVEAKDVLRRAIYLDPAGASQQRMLAWAELESGNVDGAVASTREECAREPPFGPSHIAHGLVYVQAGLRADALREVEKPISGTDDVERYDHALLCALAGKPEEARTILREAESGQPKTYTSATDLAMLAGALGDRAAGLDFLEKGDREGDRVLWLYHRGLWFDVLRDDPRFTTLLRKDGLPTDPVRRSTPRGT